MSHVESTKQLEAHADCRPGAQASQEKEPRNKGQGTCMARNKSLVTGSWYLFCLDHVFLMNHKLLH